MKNLLKKSILKLAADFPNLYWEYELQSVNGRKERVQHWLGDKNENIMVCVLKDMPVTEEFHRQDYFFINYAYKNHYTAKSYRYNNEITINEDECYIGQPFSGYAIKTDADNQPFIVGVLIKKELFYSEYLSVISNEPHIFKFFLATKTNKFSDEYLHFKFKKESTFKNILNLMIIEYANKKEDTQTVLKYFTANLLLQIARRRRELNPEPDTLPLSDRILTYMTEHSDSITLSDIAHHFSYHPNYISTLLKQETGKTFSEHLLSLRMEKALMLLKGTSLSTEEISSMIGYADRSNFYKAFKAFYGSTPSEYLKQDTNITNS